MLRGVPYSPDDQEKFAPVYLFDAQKKERLNVLKDEDTDGGGFGMTTSNVSATWSPDSRHVIVWSGAGRFDPQMAAFPRLQATGGSGDVAGR